eukprot:TRINITY_DN1164_c0_g1_i1.p1 TRINITY_DN1164_c0_g1~~TRINITY_DN1164_c0_g1_i1.p1  ORF type:complete len:119 (+),score=27.59 TRINITY_DN1164_c0_g1_i1:31-357(+)
MKNIKSELITALLNNPRLLELFNWKHISQFIKIYLTQYHHVDCAHFIDAFLEHYFGEDTLFKGDDRLEVLKGNVKGVVEKKLFWMGLDQVRCPVDALWEVINDTYALF